MPCKSRIEAEVAKFATTAPLTAYEEISGSNTPFKHLFSSSDVAHSWPNLLVLDLFRPTLSHSVRAHESRVILPSHGLPFDQMPDRVEPCQALSENNSKLSELYHVSNQSG